MADSTSLRPVLRAPMLRAFTRITELATHVTRYFEEHPILREEYHIRMDEIKIKGPYRNGRDKTSTLHLVLRINQDTFCHVGYFHKMDKPLTAVVYGVYSDLQNGIGVLLLYLQLIIAYLAGVQEVTLDNVTNVPARAALGIYEAFNVNMRGKNRSKFIGESLEGRLLLSEGEMRLVFDRSFPSHAREKLESLASRPPNPVWREDAPYVMYGLFASITQRENVWNGGTRRRSRKGGRTRRNRKRPLRSK